jgi:hypothetical protein
MNLIGFLAILFFSPEAHGYIVHGTLENEPGSLMTSNMATFKVESHVAKTYEQSEAQKFFCSPNCAFATSGSCQFRDLANNVCLPMTDEGKCLEDMIVCGPREQESIESAMAFFNFVKKHEASVDPAQVCKTSCHPGTGGFCQYPDPQNPVCMDRYFDGNFCGIFNLTMPCCPVGMVNCEDVIPPSLTVSVSPEPSPTPSTTKTQTQTKTRTKTPSLTPTRTASITVTISLTPVWQATWSG